jgi:hypothetical protein
LTASLGCLGDISNPTCTKLNTNYQLILALFPILVNSNSFLGDTQAQTPGTISTLPHPVFFILDLVCQEIQSVAFNINLNVPTSHHCHSISYLLSHSLSTPGLVQPKTLPSLSLHLEADTQLLHHLQLFRQMSFMSKAISDHPL